MITCDHMIGDDWLEGILVVDGSEEVMMDPQLLVTFDGTLKGVFRDTGEDRFVITCEPAGSKLKVSFTRVHRDGKTTDYRGKAVDIGPRRGVVGIIKGRFTRRTLRADKTLEEISGDWETERPT